MVISQDNSFRNATEIELDHGINSGVRLKSIGRGLIPVFEEHSVRIENHYSIDEWDTIPYMERAIIVAVARSKRAIANLQAEAEIRESEQKQKRNK